MTDPSALPSDAAGEPFELELKYRLVDEAAGEPLLAADRLGPFVAEGPIVTVETVDRFLDTADQTLGGIDHSLRLRTVGGRTGLVATLKGSMTQGPGGAHRRLELEAPVEGDDPSAWPESRVRTRVLELTGGRPVTEIARLRQRRRQRSLRAGRTTAELSIDAVEVVDGGRVVERFFELEVELREGDSALLAELAAALSVQPGLAPGESKLGAALRALSRRDAGLSPS
ncbi:MAG TPA: CYTH domain-containing protein [Candidatus Limnocylindrales bacterium]|nr:CYTH domain-containing protein [Candidatus Limnocylindrales bacterium]